jgi:hypothetical protein
MGGDGGGCGLEQRKRAASSTTSNPRSAVSAAVSDESVAGDSGVFEAAHHHHRKGEDLVGALAMSLETAQVQVKLRYSRQDTRAVVKTPGFFSSKFRLQTRVLDPYSILLDSDPGLLLKNKDPIRVRI